MTDNMILAAQEQVIALTQGAYEKAAAAGLLPAGGPEQEAQLYLLFCVRGRDSPVF